MSVTSASNAARSPSPIRAAIRGVASFLRRHGAVLWLTAVAALAATVFVRRRDEIGRIGTTLGGADARWLTLGVGIEVLILLATVLAYQSVLRRLGHRLPCLTLVCLHLQRVAAGAISPLSGPTSAFVFLRALNQRRVATVDGVLTITVRSLAARGASVLVILAALAFHGSMYALPVAGAVLASTTALVRLNGRRPRTGWQERPDWIGLLPGWVARRAVTFLARLRRHQLAPVDFVRPLALTLAARTGGILLLFAALRALEVAASPRTAMAAYLAAMIAGATVPIFHGVGVVEAATAVALKHSGVPADAAIGAALLWRLLDFWLPLGLGLAVQAGMSLGPRLGRRIGRGRAPAPAPLPILRPAGAPVSVATKALAPGDPLRR
jgi:phosphatidylglycerol lysyltransferase